MQTKTGVIFLQKAKFQLYSPYLASILEFNFVPELVRDFDLVNRELFDNLLKAFIANNKIPAGNFVLVLADNASFIKDFTNTPAPLQSIPTPTSPAGPPVVQPIPVLPATALEDLQAQANEFIEHVPFEVVASKTYPLPNGVRAYATNKEMFDAIRETLEKLGFIINSVIPVFAFGTEMSGLTALDLNAINTIFQKLNLVKEYNLLVNPKSAIQDFMAGTTPEKEEESIGGGVEVNIDTHNKKPTKPIVLISIASAIIVIVLGTIGVLIWQFSTPPYKPPSTPAQVPQASQVQNTPPSTVAADPKTLTVEIVDSSASSSATATLQTALTQFGFGSITPRVQADIQVPQPLVIFSPNVSATIKEQVLTQVKGVLGAALGQDKPDATVDIVIITGK